MKIPIQNLYYLLCYAWDILPPGDLVDKGFDDARSWTNLLSFVLANGTERLLRRGLERDYLLHSEPLNTIRGKILMTESLMDIHSRRGRVFCEFDDLNENTLANMILRSTIHSLHIVGDLDPEIRERLAVLDSKLHPISHIEVRKRDFRLIRFHRNNLLYKFLLNICALVLDEQIAHSKSGRGAFQNFLEDTGRMRRLFEAFVRNFLLREQSEFTPVGKVLHWSPLQTSASAISVLPRMVMDVPLANKDGMLVLECKFTPRIFDNHRGADRLRSSHLYQLYTYIRHAESTYKPNNLRGLLLYPAVGNKLRFDYQFNSYDLTVATLDLNQPWGMIHRDILELVRA